MRFPIKGARPIMIYAVRGEGGDWQSLVQWSVEFHHRCGCATLLRKEEGCHLILKPTQVGGAAWRIQSEEDCPTPEGWDRYAEGVQVLLERNGTTAEIRFIRLWRPDDPWVIDE